MPDTTRHGAVTSGFAELVCADEAWLRAEFDAIITANFGVFPPPLARPRPGSAGPRQPGRTPRAAATGDRPVAGVVSAMRGGHRQRSPPLTSALSNQRVISKGR